jgi:hypothetical protein
MPAHILEPPVQRWECAHCNTRATTRGEPNRYHDCPGLAGIMTPMVLEEHRGLVLVRTRVREDYIGGDDVTKDDNGVPIMAVETLRADGSNDLAVMAPCAKLTGRVES